MRLNDNIEKIQLRLKRLTDLTSIRFKACTIDENTKPRKENWNEGTKLKPEDTIISKNLHEDRCIIMAKITEEVVSDFVVLSSYIFFVQDDNADSRTAFQIFIKFLTKDSAVTVKVHSATKIDEVKAMLEEKEGVPVDQQRLIFGGEQLKGAPMLRDYKIPNTATMHLLERLRGGMFHFTSGREDFQNLPSYMRSTILFDNT